MKAGPKSAYRADLAALVDRGAPAFALLYRPRSVGDQVEVLVGEPRTVPRVADLPLPPVDRRARRYDLLAVLPYRQITERGLACVDDRADLMAIEVRAQARVRLDDAIAALPVGGGGLGPVTVDVGDEEYAATVRRILAEEIGRGAGSNFVIRRSLRTTVRGCPRRTALSAFRRLLTTERGAYWVFVVAWPDRVLVGATPECHARLAGGIATMNPISGTYPYPAHGPTTEGLLRFLADGKETEELFMVVDEELKVMARICTGGPRLVGPRLRAMSRLAHTEYLISGRTSADVREVLRETMVAPTVTGSPLASACRVIAANEPAGRGYYGGVVALIGQRSGERTLDSAILIRTADIRADGQVELGAGATLVRHSDPAAEAAETTAKAAALVAAFAPEPPGARSAVGPPPRWHADPRVRCRLAARNEGLSRFWRGLGGTVPSTLRGRRALVVDAEDTFTAMLAVQLRALGLQVEVSPVATARPDGHDVVVVGPGPGDPRDPTDPRIAGLRRLVAGLLATRVPVFAVCLGHQVLAGLLGLELRRLPAPAQGVRARIALFGRAEQVGFYNTFAAYSGSDALVCPYSGDVVTVLRDCSTGAVHSLSSVALASVQFHVESVLTEHGPQILHRFLTSLMAEPARVDGQPSPARS